VPDFTESAKNFLAHHINILNKKGYSTSVPQKAQYNFYVDIYCSDGDLKLLVYFGKKGNKIVLQGNKEIKSYRTVYAIIFGEQLFTDEPDDLFEPEVYIGTDESGKGDYFGPLVIAAVLTNSSLSKQLVSFGVRDSKELTDQSISLIAGKIKKIKECTHDVIVINPEKYNLLYNKFGNLNKLLGWAHAKAIENVLSRKFAPEAISDKFGNEKYIYDSLQEKGKKIKLHQVTKAERYTAVAAASILARDSFSKWFIDINRKMKINLPKGASAGVEQKAREVKSRLGDDTLSKLVKLHFKTTKKL
jgi:ribonuclease HIII